MTKQEKLNNLENLSRRELLELKDECTGGMSLLPGFWEVAAELNRRDQAWADANN